MPSLHDDHPFDYTSFGEKILDLRSRGHSLARISEEVGVTPTKVRGYLDHYLRKTYSDRDALVTAANLQLDFIYRAYLREYDHPFASARDKRESLAGLLKTVEQKRKLQGLDAPTRVEVKDVDEFSDEELVKRAREYGIIDATVEVLGVAPLPLPPAVTSLAATPPPEAVGAVAG